MRRFFRNIVLSVAFCLSMVFAFQSKVVLAQETYDYQYQYGEEGVQMLPGWDKGIDNAFNCHVEVEGSEPRDEDVQITGAEITTNVPSEPDENVIELDGNSNEGWNIHANNFGYAEITIYYTNLNDSSDSYTFSVWVCEDVYDLRIDSSTGTDNILPGGTMDLSANMNHYAFEKEEENLPGALDDKVILQWSCEDEENLDNILTFEQDETDQRICHVTVNNNVTDDSDIHFVLRAYEKDDNQENGIAKDEKDNPIELASSEFCVCVRQEYYIVEPQYLETNRLPIGDSVTITPQLYCYNINNPNGEEITQFVYDDEETYPVEYLPEYNTEEGQINVIENQDGSFTVERTGNGEAWLRIKAGHYCNDQEYNFNEYVSSFYYWNSNEYEIWFEDFREDGWTWNFTDEPINYEMRTTEDIEALDPEKIQFSYSYGYWDEENETIVKIAGLDLDEYLKDGTDGVAAVIFIPADKVEEIRNAIIKATDGNSDWLQVRVLVYYNDQEISSYRLGIQLCEPFYDYQYPYYGINMLPDWGNHIDTKFNCYVENGEHPYGEDMEVTITDATIENDPETPKAISLEQNDDGSWNIHANYYGHAIITIEYTRLEDGQQDSHSFDVSVNGDVYDLWVESSTGTDNILPGGSMDFTAYMNHYAFGEEEENLPGTLDDKVILRWSYEDEENISDIFTFTQDQENQNICHIEVGSNIDWDREIRLVVRAYAKDEKGNIAVDDAGQEIELASTDFRLYIRNEYYMVEPKDLETDSLALGDSVTVTPSLKRYYRDSTELEEVTGLVGEDRNYYSVSYFWDYDDEQLKITDNENGSYTITRIGTEGTGLELRAGYSLQDEEIVYASMIYYLDYHAHTLKKVPSKSATATAPGNKEYWYCEECERYFSDAEATKEITLESTVIPATGPTSPENGTGASGNTTPAGTGNTSTVNAVPELSIGTIVYDAKTKANYKVISSGASGNAVEYIKPTGNPTGITISESITVNGISYKVTGVAKNAFKGKKKLTKVIIGKNVVTIGANAFKNCKKLKSITIKSQKFTSKSIAKNAFKGLGKGMTIKVPKNKLKAYKKLFKSKGLGSKVKIK